MNFFQKKVLALSAFIAQISLTLTVAGVATFAWFQSNTNAQIQVSSSSMTIETADPDEKLQYKFYKYSDDIKAGKGYTDPADFTLPDYDTYITEKNVHANIILRAEVSVSALSTSDYEFAIDVTRLASDFISNNKIGKYTSNIVQLKSTVYAFKEVGEEEYTINTASLNDIDETSDATIYSSATDYFSAKKTPTTFVPIRYLDDGTPVVNRGNKVTDRTITLIPDLPNGYTITAVVMYLEFSYNTTLVNEYVRTNQSENATKYSLTGDISSITFAKKAKADRTSLATGKYIKVESNNGLVNGQFLHAYETNTSTGAGKILKGRLAASNKAATAESGIYVNNNTQDVVINSNPSTQPKSIDSTDEIDKDSFDFDKAHNTFKSKSGYYIGNNTASQGMATNDTYSSGYSHQIGFADSHSTVNSYGSTGAFDMRMRYNSSSNKFYYYKGDGEKTDLFRYTENVAEMPTLSSIAITTSSSKTTFYTGQKFSIPSLVVTATYTNGSTANVTGSCTFTSDTSPTTLVPEGRTGATTLNSTATDKTIYINYSEGGVTIADEDRPSYTIDVIQEALSSIVITTQPTTRNYYVGTPFSADGMKVKAVYNSGREELDITPTSITAPDMSTAGNNKTVTVSYTSGGVTKDTTTTINVRAKALSIDKNSQSIYEGSSFTIAVTHNQAVSITESSNDGGDVTFNPSSISYSNSDKAAITTNVTVTGTHVGTVTLTFSSANVPDVTCTITIDEKITVTDEIDHDKTVGTLGSTTTSAWHSDFSITGESGVSYTIHSMGTSGGSHALQWNSSGFLYSTTAETNNWPITSISAVTNDKSISFYGSNTAFSSNSGGDLLGSISGTGSLVRGTNFNGDYKYIRVVGTTSSTQVTSISITFGKTKVTSVSLNKSETTIMRGNTETLTATVLPSNATDKTVTWTSSNSTVASVNSSGVVTANAAGDAVITATTNDGSFTASCTVHVVTSIAVTGVTIASTSSVNVGSTVNLSSTVTVSPANATNKTVSYAVYSASPAGCATVNSSTGVVSGVAAGTAVIRVTTQDGNFTADCTVTVNAVAQKYSVTYQANGGSGSDYVVSNITSGSSHTLVTFATSGFTAPNNKQFKCWSVGGVEKNPGTSITVSANTTVLAVWEDAPSGYTVSFNANGGSGSITSVSNVSGSYTLPSSTGLTKPSGADSFAGWSVGSAATATIYQAGSSITVSANTTLYARWQWTKTYTFTNSSWSASGGISGLSWSSSIAANSFESASPSRGVQIGAAKGQVTLTLSSSSTYTWKQISSVSSSNDTGNSMQVKVGGTNFGSSITIAKSNNASYSTNASSPVRGELTIVVQDNKKSVYFKSITVVYIS